MAHIIIDPQTHHHSSHAGEIGFYSVLGMLAVIALAVLGVYWLAQSALQGVANMVAGL